MKVMIEKINEMELKVKCQTEVLPIGKSKYP